MNRIPRELEMKIIFLWLVGWMRDDIAQKLGIVGATVTAVVSNLPAELMEIREVTRHFRKIGLPALPLRQLLEKIVQAAGHGFAVEKLPALIEYAVKTATDKSYEAEAVVDAAAKVHELEQQSGKPYPEAFKEHYTITAENAGLHTKNTEMRRKFQLLEQKYSGLRRKCVDAERERRRKLRKSGVTDAEIDAVNELKRQYRESGEELDGKKLKRTIDFINKSGCKPKEFARMAKGHDSIQEATKAAEEERQQKQRELASDIAAAEHARLNLKREQARGLKDKAVADTWQDRITYLKQVAASWEAYLQNLAADTQNQACFHDAIIEQNIRNLGLPPDAATEYRLQKRAELRATNFEEIAWAFEAGMLRRIRSIFRREVERP